MVHSFLGSNNRNRKMKANARLLCLEHLESRVVPATGSFNSSTGTLSFNYTSSGSTVESVTLTNNGTTITATGNVSGTTNFSTSAVKAILITASGSSTAQVLSFAGTSTFNISSGLSVTGIESVTIGAVINTGSSNFSMTLGQGVAINSAITTTTGNITIVCNNGTNSFTGNFYGIRASANVTTTGGNIDWIGRGGTDSSGNKVGILIDNGSTVSTGGNGSIKLSGTGGLSSGVYNHGVAIVGKNSARSTIVKTANGNIEINGTGGGVTNGGGSNYGVYIQIGGVVSAGGIGSVSVNASGGLPSGGMGLYIDADAISGDNSTFIGSSGGQITINAIGGGAGNSLGFRGRGQIGIVSDIPSLASVNQNIILNLIPGPTGSLGIYNETSLGKIISGTGNIEINSDYYTSFWGITSLVTSGKLSLLQAGSGFLSAFKMSSFLSGYQVNSSGNGF
ncbi:MAG: hypothetical protein ACKO9Z_14445, partial [Planctomycetota bacterium]